MYFSSKITIEAIGRPRTAKSSLLLVIKKAIGSKVALTTFHSPEFEVLDPLEEIMEKDSLERLSQNLKRDIKVWVCFNYPKDLLPGATQVVLEDNYEIVLNVTTPPNTEAAVRSLLGDALQGYPVYLEFVTIWLKRTPGPLPNNLWVDFVETHVSPRIRLDSGTRI